MVKIVWTELSILDLKETFDYIADDSVRYANLTTNKIFRRAQDLELNPYLGRVVPEFNEKLVRELIEGSYRIIYRIKKDNQVDVLRIYHSARVFNKKP